MFGLLLGLHGGHAPAFIHPFGHDDWLAFSTGQTGSETRRAKLLDFFHYYWSSLTGPSKARPRVQATFSKPFFKNEFNQTWKLAPRRETKSGKGGRHVADFRSKPSLICEWPPWFLGKQGWIFLDDVERVSITVNCVHHQYVINVIVHAPFAIPSMHCTDLPWRKPQWRTPPEQKALVWIWNKNNNINIHALSRM